MTIQITEKKAPAALKIVAKGALIKEGAHGLKAQVVKAIDISPSMEWDHQKFFSRGIVQGLFDRVLGVAEMLDDNGRMPVYWFNDTCGNWGEVHRGNRDTFLMDHYRKCSGGTAYAPIIRQIVADAQRGDPILALIFTDGENSDAPAAAQALIDASRLPIFFQWFGIFADHRQMPAFRFLRQMDEMTGRVIDNAGFSPLGLVDVTDEELMRMTVHEFKDFPGKVAASGGRCSWDNLNSQASGRANWNPFRR